MRPVATPAPKPPPVEAPEDGLLTEDRDCSDSETKATLPRTRVVRCLVQAVLLSVFGLLR